MNLFLALLLGIIQGLTEFIPVSSTAHLLITEHLMGLDPNEIALFSFSVLIQIGTIVSLVVYFWEDLFTIASDTLKNLDGLRDFKQLPMNAKMGWYIVIATLPALLAGVLFKDMVEALFKTPLLEAAIRLFAAAILLACAEYFGRRVRKLESMTWLDALTVGLFQVIAVFPGASRSGSTISGGMLRGLDRPSAARFAFLMSVPVMLAAGLYEMLDVLQMPDLATFLPLLAVGFVSAAITGWFAIRWLIAFLGKRSLYGFAVYCALLGAACLAVYLF